MIYRTIENETVIQKTKTNIESDTMICKTIEDETVIQKTIEHDTISQKTSERDDSENSRDLGPESSTLHILSTFYLNFQ